MEWSTIAGTVIDNRRLLESHHDSAAAVAAPGNGASVDGDGSSAGNAAPN